MGPRRVYYDDTINKAIKRIKLDIGPAAVILSTKRVVKNGRNMFEVVATVDPNKQAEAENEAPMPRNARKAAKTSQKAMSDSGDPVRNELIGNLQNAYSSMTPGAQKAIRAKMNQSELNAIGFDNTNKASDMPKESKSQPMSNFVKDDNIELGNLALKLEKKIDDALGKNFLNRIEAIEQSFLNMKDQITPIMEGSKYSNDYLLPQLFAKFIPMMTKKGVPESLASKLINLCFRALRNEGSTDEDSIKDWLELTLNKKIQIFKIEKSKSLKRTIMFAGPAGVGKTTTIAKMAAKAALNQKLKVCLISMDSHRIAALDQLKKYSELIGVRFEVALTPEGLKALLPKLKDYDRIFIDTKGSNFVSKGAASEFLNQFKGLNLESSLVLSASTDLEINERIMNNFEEAGYDHMILTKLDESHKNGCLWSLGMKSKMPLSYMADGPNIPEDIRKASVRKLFEMVIPN